MKREKSLQFFSLIWKSKIVTKNTIRKLYMTNNQNESSETKDELNILNHAQLFYSNVFKRKRQNNIQTCNQFL